MTVKGVKVTNNKATRGEKKETESNKAKKEEVKKKQNKIVKAKQNSTGKEKEKQGQYSIFHNEINSSEWIYIPQK